MTSQQEQLRRLQNTLMGASHRLSVLAGDPSLEPQSFNLRSLADAIAAIAQQLQQLRGQLTQE